MFYHVLPKGRFVGTIKGFPQTNGSWCKHLKTDGEADIRRYILSHPQTDLENAGGGRYGFPAKTFLWCTGELKQRALNNIRISHRQGAMVQQRPQTQSLTAFQSQSAEEIGAQLSKPPLDKPLSRGADKNSVIQYLGIAADEPIRIERHTKEGIELPLVQIGWEEAYCRKWCEDNDLLSPIYISVTRGGCWFCHNQSINQLRLLRQNYPELWALLLKWDLDSPLTFHADGHTVHDFDKRFEMEDRGWLDPNSNKFRWEFINDPFYAMMYGETEKDAERHKLREYFDKIEEVK